MGLFSGNGKFLLTASVVLLGLLLFEPRVPLDTADFWKVFLIEKFYRLQDLIRYSRGKTIIDAIHMPPNLAPEDPLINNYKRRIAEVDIRIYDRIDRKETQHKAGPLFVYMHGGGWAKGSTDAHDLTVYSLAKKLDQFLFVSVDYRLAPAHVFPAALDDVEAVYRFLVKHAVHELIDVDRIVVGGDSAGGNLAAALCLRIRDANRKALPADVIATPKLQVLLYPALQAVDLKTPSYQQATPVLHSDDMAAFYVNYLTGGVEGYEKVMENQHVSPEMKRDYAEKYVKHGLIPKELHSNYEPPVSQDFDAQLSTKLERMVTDPYFAPLMAADLTDLPSAYVVTCQYDVLRDDGILYALRLQGAGVPTELKVYKGAWHVIMMRLSLMDFPTGITMTNEMVDFIKENV